MFRAFVYFISVFILLELAGVRPALAASPASATSSTEPENQGETSVRIDSTPQLTRPNVQYLAVNSGVQIPIHYLPPTQTNKITFVIIGGFEARIENFDVVAHSLSSLGYGVLRLELNGQGELVSRSPVIEPIALSFQSQDLISILDQLKLDKTKIALVGESYGAGVAIQSARDIFLRDKVGVASLNLINPLVPTTNFSFASVYMRFKNISGVLPDDSSSIQNLLTFLSSRGEYAAQNQSSVNLADVTSAYELLLGVPLQTVDEVDQLATKVHVFDGLADLVVAQADKVELFMRVPIEDKGLYFRGEGVGHRALEEAPESVGNFLIYANP